MTPQRRRATFVAIVILALGAIGQSVWRARPSSRATSPAVAPPTRLTAPPDRPFVVVRHLADGDEWSHVALIPLAALDGPRFVAPLRCSRVYSSGGRGLCLETSGLGGRAILLDADWQPTATLALTGPPSRARVSRDGRFAAYTVFETGHSYADADFSTRTTIVDTATATPLPDLETWPAWQGTTRVSRTDSNFWGITFHPDGRHVYATLAFGGTPYLVRGDLESREFHVLARDIECPSLSPDARRIAFKRADGPQWRLWVRDLASGAEHPIVGETRNIDDQVEGLDDGRVLYQVRSGVALDVFVAEVDGATPARVFVRDAWSPSVVR